MVQEEPVSLDRNIIGVLEYTLYSRRKREKRDNQIKRARQTDKES